MDPMMDRLYAYVDQHAERALQLLERLAAQPSISAQKLGLNEMAELCRQTMADYGVPARLLPTRGGPPIVYGEVQGRSPKTLLLYNHYDVQPVDPLDLWQSPPFEPTRREGKLYARGVADNKDNIAIRLEAVRAWRDIVGELPFTVKFLFEGEEESGSPHFYQFVEEHRDLLKADACLMEADGLGEKGEPHLVPGVKGMLNVQLSVRTAQTDAHSAYAAVAPSAAWRLLWAVASLKAPDGRILIDGFYDDVRELNELEQAALRAAPSIEESLRQMLGMPAFLDNLTGYAWQERLYNGTTCNINGFITGYTGAGYKTVLPAAASAKLDFRLVPNQRPRDILAKLRRHLDTHGFWDVEIEVYGAEGPARTPLDDPFIQFMERVSAEFAGKPTVTVPNNAGTAPMDALVEVLGVPTAFSLGGAGYYGSSIHAPNEHIRIADLAQAIKFTLLLFARFAEFKR
jgi:acetylornithine deacetylase/succinyl-diaminopimelate desuccinylase-like protein